MKIKKAIFRNFRILRNIEIDFSSDEQKKLTVIRAANESGKTTMLLGLQWALFGDEVLQRNSSDDEGFRLHPIDWDHEKESIAQISVTIEYENKGVVCVGGKLIPKTKVYRLTRSAIEEVFEKSWKRKKTEVILHEITDRGYEPCNDPKSRIAHSFPNELREIFFIDGDRALSFIEASVDNRTKREKVQKAIKSLLGIRLIDEAIEHTKRSASEVNKRLKNEGKGKSIEEIAERIEEYDTEIGKESNKLINAKEQYLGFAEQINKIELKIEEALRKGDRESLVLKLDKAKTELQKTEKFLQDAMKEHSNLFRSQALCKDLMQAFLKKGLEKLDDLHEQGTIPSGTIPVLEERLALGVCICGESLNGEDPLGKTRRENIEKMIVDNKRSDDIRKIATEVYFSTKSWFGPSGDNSTWLNNYMIIASKRTELEEKKDQWEAAIKEIETEIDSLPNVDVKELRKIKKDLESRRDHFLTLGRDLEHSISLLEASRKELIDERDKLMKENDKFKAIRNELNFIKTIQEVFFEARNRILNDEVKIVGEKMNEYFLEMIGSDPEQSSIIVKSTINQDFDILVFGPRNRYLDPDRDLNGASKRALTFAFILALTIISKVEAPNVIDTPLGMTSGFVKKSIVTVATRESKQLVLFLTPDEIKGCEEILDKEGGSFATLTNPNHYPISLVNDSGERRSLVLKCNCTHREECQICARKESSFVGREVL